MTKIPLPVYVEAIKRPRNNDGCNGNCRARCTDLCAPDKCSNYPPTPYCSQPDDRWPPQINACLREILRYRKQQIDPEGYRKELQEASDRAKQSKISGGTEGGRKE